MLWIFPEHMVINKREYEYGRKLFANLERMIHLKSIVKRFVSIFMALAIVCTFSSVAFASDVPATVPSRDIAVSQDADALEESRSSLGDIIASGATTIYGGSGVLRVYLPTTNFWTDLVAGIGYTPQSGVVTVTVTTPNNQSIYLGSMSGTGSTTSSQELAYAPAGTYYFYFTSAIQEPMEVYARLYDWYIMLSLVSIGYHS